MRKQQPEIFAAVLAAGRASRFGATKQLVEVHGAPLVTRAVSVAAEACDDRVITVIGHDWQEVVQAMHSSAGFLVMNEDYRTGLGSSIAAAARACNECADAVLLVFADQPLVTVHHLRTLIERWSGSDSEIVATAYRGTQGPPVLFPRATFDALCDLAGDTGARALFRDSRFTLQSVEFDDAAIDIDTQADLAALL
ncbi:MAG: nucleotidyltransferase family protein [Woeseiaceae bacterium]|nr:nucleotidyltransferase family protein [Woeseiaceae bacterium]